MRGPGSIVWPLFCAALAAQSPFPVPELGRIAVPVLERAREHPQELLRFLTDPDTPFDQALAAAERCGPAFPIGIARELLLAWQELQRQGTEHGFGFLPPPGLSMPVLGPAVAPVDRPAERTILGRAWTLPAERSPYPSTWEEAAAAPWPWRVQHVVPRAFGAITKAIGTPSIGDHNEAWWRRVEAWYAECATWPLDTDDDALAYVTATMVPRHGKSTAVLARWWRILRDPRTPQAAARIAHALGETQRLLLHGDDDARAACEVLLIDGMRSSPHLQARWGCAYQLRGFLTRCGRRMKEEAVPCPPAALLIAGDRAADPAHPDLGPGPGHAWNQLYVYAFSVCEAVDDPPFEAERSMPNDRQDIAGRLAAFAEWWRVQRPKIAAAAGVGAAERQKLRERLDALAR